MRPTYRPYRDATGFKQRPGYAAQLAVRFTDADLEQIIGLSRTRGTSAAAVVRDLVSLGLKTMRGDAK